MSSALPEGWEKATAENGKEYYYNRSTGKTSWERPLPKGWESRQDAAGRTYFIDHNTKSTTYEDPRNAPPTSNLSNLAVTPSVAEAQPSPDLGRLQSAKDYKPEDPDVLQPDQLEKAETEYVADE